MDKPLISIVICCHNRLAYLPQTLESVFAQTYEPVEIVVLDDGSTDGTAEFMRQFGDTVRYQWQRQHGSAAARNAACRIAKGEYIAFLDDDDLMVPDRISLLFDALRTHPSAVFATAGHELMDEKGNPTGQRYLPAPPEEEGASLLVKDAYKAVIWPLIPAMPITTLFRRADGERIGWFDANFRYASSDKDFYARLARLGPMVYVRKVVGYVRRGHSSIWSNERAIFSRLQLLNKHISLLNDDEHELHKRLRWRIVQVLRKIAEYRATGLNVSDAEACRHVDEAWANLHWLDRVKYYRYLPKLKIRKMLNKTQSE